MARARRILLCTLIPLGVATRHGQLAQRDALRLDRVKDDVYVIYGNGGNTAVFVGTEAVVVVDSKFETDGAEIVARVKAVTNKPIRFLVNTHHHADHTYGNPAFPDETEIVAHENARQNLLRSDANYWKGPRERGLPRRLVKDRLELGKPDDPVEVLYYGRGHTNGDICVIVPRVRTAHLGDLFVHRAIPLIDTQAGGSAREFLDAIEKIAARKDIETYIPGHGEVVDRTRFREYVELLRALDGATRKAVKDKQPLEKFLGDLKLEPYTGWRGYPDRLRQNAAILYTELQAEAEAKSKKRK